jgi:hypothetical protein
MHKSSYNYSLCTSIYGTHYLFFSQIWELLERFPVLEKPEVEGYDSGRECVTHCCLIKLRPRFFFNENKLFARLLEVCTGGLKTLRQNEAYGGGSSGIA